MPKIKISKSGNYLIDGREYARVTSVVAMIERTGLTQWKAKVGIEEAERIAEETADFGERVHHMTVVADKSSTAVAKILDADTDLVPSWVAYEHWKAEYLDRWIATELVVWSDRLGCAGRIDRIGYLKGDKRSSIFDFKTGSLYDEIGMQLGGYKIIYNEKGRPRVYGMKVIWMPRKEPGKIQVKDYTDDKYIKRFKEAAKLYHSLKFEKC